jgi:hypothetical protein
MCVTQVSFDNCSPTDQMSAMNKCAANAEITLPMSAIVSDNSNC